MANEKHLAILKKGIKTWNLWRKDNPFENPDLSNIDLSGYKYEEANFSNTNFQNSHLDRWVVTDCDFSKSLLTGIHAQRSSWRNAKFCNAHITGDLVLSRIYIADFTGAIIEKCGLPEAEWRFLRLNHTKFSPYMLQTMVNSWTILQSDLSGIQNPQNAQHEFPSNIDFATLQKTSTGLAKQPELVSKFSVFFQGCGLPSEIISVFESWVREKPTDVEVANTGANYYSCFISYSHADADFAKRLHSELQEYGIQCWLDDVEMLPGDDILEMVDWGIRKWDKVLLCCSRNSLSSPWVDREMEKALIKEEQLWRSRKQKTRVIIPLDLDGYMYEWESGKASVLKSRMAADFTSWPNDEARFQAHLEKLIKALRTDNLVRSREPKPKI